MSSTLSTRPINFQPNDYTVFSIQWSLAAHCVQYSNINRSVLCSMSASNILLFTWWMTDMYNSTDSLQTYQLNICDDIPNGQNKGFSFVPRKKRITINIPLCELNHYDRICERGEKEEGSRGKEAEKREEHRRKGRHQKKGRKWPGYIILTMKCSINVKLRSITCRSLRGIKVDS